MQKKVTETNGKLVPVIMNVVYYRAIGIGQEFDQWQWRTVANFRDRIKTMTGGRQEPNYKTFSTNVLSHNWMDHFVWLERNLKTGTICVHVGDVAECDFTMTNPDIEVLLPKGWTKEVIRLVEGGVMQCSTDGTVTLTSGEVGKLMQTTESRKFMLGV